MYMGKVSLSRARSLSLSLSFSAYFPSAFKVKISSVTSSISAA